MGKRQTFILEINDTQYQSWQGSVEWVQGQDRQSFRSVMELLRLIDSVVCPGTAQNTEFGETDKTAVCTEETPEA